MAKPVKQAEKLKTFRGVAAVNKKLSDEERALIWQLTEEGFSQREIGERLGCGRTAVTRTLADDPVALEQVRTVLREARAAKWKRCEDLGISEANAWTEMLNDTRAKLALALQVKNKRERRSQLKELYELLHIIPRIIQATKGSAGESAKQVQLLTGGVTERLGTAINDDDLSPEQLCQRAIMLGRESELPPRLREYALKLKTRQATSVLP